MSWREIRVVEFIYVNKNYIVSSAYNVNKTQYSLLQGNNLHSNSKHQLPLNVQKITNIFIKLAEDIAFEAIVSSNK